MQLSSKPLTERETEVLAMVRQGLPYAEIASQCFITVRTVKKHVASICEKHGMNCTDRHALCLRLNFIEIGELRLRVERNEGDIGALLQMTKNLAETSRNLVEAK